MTGEAQKAFLLAWKAELDNGTDMKAFVQPNPPDISRNAIGVAVRLDGKTLKPIPDNTIFYPIHLKVTRDNLDEMLSSMADKPDSYFLAEWFSEQQLDAFFELGTSRLRSRHFLWTRKSLPKARHLGKTRSRFLTFAGSPSVSGASRLSMTCRCNSAPGRSWACSAPTARESRRCRGSWRRRFDRTPARFWSAANCRLERRPRRPEAPDRDRSPTSQPAATFSGLGKYLLSVPN